VLIGLGLAAGGFGAGIFGALLGLGGGILIVPVLTFGFGLPFREAVGISLVSVIVTSSAGAGVYLQRHVANLRLGMLLEVFTASGALVGGLVAFALSDRVLAGLFAVLLLYTAFTMLRRRPGEPAANGTNDGTNGGADGDGGGGADGEVGGGPVEESVSAGAVAAPVRDPFLARLGGPGYQPHSLGIGVAGGFFAGIVSALLGVGGGIVKVPVMHLSMGVPLKVATATSNMMIGVTAAASAIVYLLRGGIDPLVAGPTAVGVFGGAMLGTRVARRIDVRYLRLLFVGVLLFTAAQMTLKAIG
jgi:uncharacterized protein